MLTLTKRNHNRAIQVGLILSDFFLLDFSVMHLENILYFSNFGSKFPFNMIWHTRSVAALVLCWRLAETGVTVTPSVTCGLIMLVISK
jgi:hypothetical protein